MTGQQPTADWSPGPPAPPAAPLAWVSSPAASPPLVQPLPAVAAARVLLVALVAGLAAQYLFVGQRPGLNVLLWIALVLGATWLLRRPGARIERADVWLPAGALLFAGFVALRNEAPCTPSTSQRRGP